MASYVSKIVAGANVFAGYTTSTPSRTSTTGGGAYGTARFTVRAVASNPAGLGAPVKMEMVPGTKPTITQTAKIKVTGLSSTNTKWWEWVSHVRPTPYTQAMKLSGGQFKISYKRASGLRAFAEAYDSAGVRQASTMIVSGQSAGGGSVSLTMTVPTTKAITVPAGGYAVVRIQGRGNTSRTKMTMKLGQTANGGMLWSPNEAPAIVGPPTEIREVLKDATGANYPNGTKVYCYSATGALEWTGAVGQVTGSPQNTGHASVLPAGPGEVVFEFNNGDLAQRYLVVDPGVDADGLVTNLITPTQLV